MSYRRGQNKDFCCYNSEMSMDIIPGTASYQTGQERNKDIRSSRKLSRGYYGRLWRRITGSWKICSRGDNDEQSVFSSIPGLVLPDIFYHIKKKFGCIFVENHNPESILLKLGQTIGSVLSCIVTQEE